jgi:hypothetical protein
MERLFFAVTKAGRIGISGMSPGNDCGLMFHLDEGAYAIRRDRYLEALP